MSLFRGYSCRTLLSDTLVEHSCGTLLRGTFAGHPCRTLLWNTLVGHYCGTLLSDTLLGHFKSAKRGFRTRRPPKVTRQSSKVSVKNSRFESASEGSRTAVSNSSSRSNSWRSTMTWYSSPEREVNWRWTTSWRSLLTSELVCDSMSQCMAVLFPVPVLATGGLSLAVQRGSYLGNRPCSLRPGTTLLVVARRSFNSVSYKGQSNHCP